MASKGLSSVAAESSLPRHPGGGTADGRLFEKGDKMKKTAIKIQTTLDGEAAELFLAACKRNHRKMAGEAAARIEHTLMEEQREIEATVARQKEI